MNRLLQRCNFRFGLRKNIFDILYTPDTSSQSYKIVNSSIHTQPEGVSSRVYQPTNVTYNTTKLPSGLTVLTESVNVPSNVMMGIFMDVGSRDQTAESSGSMLSLKNTYLKTAINTNETVNYGVAQMAGGQIDMYYNRESAFYRCDCLSHDVIDVFGVLVDCAFEPKNHVSANVGAFKNDQTHKLDAQLGGNQKFNDDIYTAAYGNRNLGMPLQGRKSNVANLSVYVLQQFQRQNITPNRVVISATGIQNHQEFVDLVNEKMYYTQLSTKSREREQAKYTGGEIRNLLDSANIHIALAFEGDNHKNCLPLFIARQIMGNNRPSGRINKNILGKNASVDGAEAFYQSYQDTGIFGIRVSGSAANANQVLNAAAKQLSDLRNASDAQINLAKSAFIGRTMRSMSKNWRRIQERSKALYYSGQLYEDYAGAIQNVSADQVREAIKKLYQSKLTLVATGGQVNTLPSYDKISQLFQ